MGLIRNLGVRQLTLFDNWNDDLENLMENVMVKITFFIVKH
jgi:hypothetical protein